MKRLLSLLFCLTALASEPLPGSTVHIFAVGDSKTFFTPGWVSTLVTDLNALGYVRAYESPYRVAGNGRTVATTKAVIDHELSIRTNMPQVVLINLGVNDDWDYMGDPATWVANYGYVLDAIHAKWPMAHCYIARVWTRETWQGPNNFVDDDLMPLVVQPRSTWAHLGIDERICLEGGDNGYTNTYDGVHLTPAGFEAEAHAWMSVLGIVPQP